MSLPYYRYISLNMPIITKIVTIILSYSTSFSGQAPPLEPHEKIIKTADNCGIVIDQNKVSAKFMENHISKLTFGGVCHEGLAMGEGWASEGNYEIDPGVLPQKSWFWYGRQFGESETKFESGISMFSFTWNNQHVQYRSLDQSKPVWSKNHVESSIVIGLSKTATAISIGQNFGIGIFDLKSKKSEIFDCPTPKSTVGCEKKWMELVSPVMNEIKAFKETHKTEVQDRKKKIQELIGNVKSASNSNIEKLHADRKAEGLALRAQKKEKLKDKTTNSENVIPKKSDPAPAKLGAVDYKSLSEVALGSSDSEITKGWESSETMDVTLRDKIAESKKEIVDSAPFKISVEQFTATAARLRSCDKMDYGKPKEMIECKIRTFQYDLNGFVPKYTIMRNNNSAIPLCQFSPGVYSLATIDRVPPDISCRHLLLQAIHEQFEWQLQNPKMYRNKIAKEPKTDTKPTKAEINCTDGLSKIENETNEKIKKSSNMDTVEKMEILMGSMEKSIEQIENTCPESNDYKKAQKQFYQTLKETKTRCDAIASAPPCKARK